MRSLPCARAGAARNPLAHGLRSRSFLPRSLFGRALAILLVPIVVLQLVVGLVFFQRHYQRVTEQMTRSVAYELAYAVEQVEAAGTPRRPRCALAELALPARPPRCGSSPGAGVEPGVDRDFFDFTGAKVVETFEAAFARPLRIDLARPARRRARDPAPALGVLEAAVPRDRLSVSNPHQLLVLMILGRAPADRRRGRLPAQPGPPDPRPRRGGRGLRQGPLAALPPGRRRGGPPRRRRLPRRCARGSSARSSSAPRCSPASATTCARRSPG